MKDKIVSAFLLFFLIFSYIFPVSIYADATNGIASPWTYEKAAHLARKSLFWTTQSQIQSLYDAWSAQAAVDILFPSIDWPDRTQFTQDLLDFTMTDGFNPTWASMYEYYLMNKMLDPYEAKAKLFLIFEDTFSTNSFWWASLSYIDIQQNHDLLYSHTLGNYKEMVKRNLYNNGSTGDYAVGEFLDLFNQTRPNSPNENYSRELLQLMLMLEYIPTESEDSWDTRNYTEQDVEALSKILFWFRADENTHQVSYDAASNTNTTQVFLSGELRSWDSFSFYDHSTGEIDIQSMKNSIAWNNGLPDNIIDYIFSKRDYEIAMFLADKFHRFYVSENSSRANLDAIANQIISNDFEIYPTIKWLLSQDMMYSNASMNTDIYKNPMELTIGLMKTLEIPFSDLASPYLTNDIWWRPYAPWSIFGRDGYDINSNFFTAYTATKWSWVASRITNSSSLNNFIPLNLGVQALDWNITFSDADLRSEQIDISLLTHTGTINLENITLETLSWSQIIYSSGVLDINSATISDLTNSGAIESSNELGFNMNTSKEEIILESIVLSSEIWEEASSIQENVEQASSQEEVVVPVVEEVIPESQEEVIPEPTITPEETNSEISEEEVIPAEDNSQENSNQEKNPETTEIESWDNQEGTEESLEEETQEVEIPVEQPEAFSTGVTVVENTQEWSLTGSLDTHTGTGETVEESAQEVIEEVEIEIEGAEVSSTWSTSTGSIHESSSTGSLDVQTEVEEVVDEIEIEESEETLTGTTATGSSLTWSLDIQTQAEEKIEESVTSWTWSTSTGSTQENTASWSLDILEEQNNPQWEILSPELDMWAVLEEESSENPETSTGETNTWSTSTGSTIEVESQSTLSWTWESDISTLTWSLNIFSGYISTQDNTLRISSWSLVADTGVYEISWGVIVLPDNYSMDQKMSPDNLISFLEKKLYFTRELPSNVREQIVHFMSHDENDNEITNIDFSNTSYFNTYVRGALHIMLMQPEYIMQTYANQSVWISPSYSSFYNSDSKLVIVQAFGWVDWLHALMPKDEYAQYVENRGVWALTGNEIISLNDEYYMNAELSSFKPIFDEGNLKIINRVWTPLHSRGHDSAMRKMTSKNNLYDYSDDGIIGSFIWSENPLKTISLGSNRFLHLREWNYLTVWSRAYYEVNHSGVTNSSRDYRIGTIKDIYNTRIFSAWASNIFKSSVEVDDVARTSNSMWGSAGAGNNMEDNFIFAEEIFDQNISNIVTMRADGGYDSHGNQKQRVNTNFAKVADATSDFFNRMKGKEDITLLFFSEFWRTLKINTTDGTDHGMWGWMFIFTNNANLKAKLNSGVYGNLSFVNASGNWLGVGIDYRSVYSTILEELYGHDISGALGWEYNIDDYIDDTPVEISLLREEYERIDASRSRVRITFNIHDTNFHLKEWSHITFGYGTDPNALQEVSKYSLARYDTLADNGASIRVWSTVTQGQEYFYEIKIYDNQYNEKIISGSFVAPSILPVWEFKVETSADTRIRSYEEFVVNGQHTLPNPIILSGTGETVIQWQSSRIFAGTGAQVEWVESPAWEIIQWSGIFKIPQELDKDFFIAPWVSFSWTLLENAHIPKIIKIWWDKPWLRMNLNQDVEVEIDEIDTTKNYIVIQSEDGVNWQQNMSELRKVWNSLRFSTDHFSFFAVVEVDNQGNIVVEPETPVVVTPPVVSTPSTWGGTGSNRRKKALKYKTKDVCEYGDFTGDYYDGKCWVDPDIDIATAMYDTPEEYNKWNTNDQTNTQQIGWESDKFKLPDTVSNSMHKKWVMQDYKHKNTDKIFQETENEEMMEIWKIQEKKIMVSPVFDAKSKDVFLDKIYKKIEWLHYSDDRKSELKKASSNIYLYSSALKDESLNDEQKQKIQNLLIWEIEVFKKQFNTANQPKTENIQYPTVSKKITTSEVKVEDNQDIAEKWNIEAKIADKIGWVDQENILTREEKLSLVQEKIKKANARKQERKVRLEAYKNERNQQKDKAALVQEKILQANKLKKQKREEEEKAIQKMMQDYTREEKKTFVQEKIKLVNARKKERREKQSVIKTEKSILTPKRNENIIDE